MCFLGRLDKCGSVANRDTASRWWFARGFPQLRPPRLLSRRRCRVPRAAPALACPSPNRPEVVGVLGFYTTRLRFPRPSGRCRACVRLVLARPRTRSGAYSNAAASPFDVGWRDSNPRLFVPNNGNQGIGLSWASEGKGVNCRLISIFPSRSHSHWQWPSEGKKCPSAYAPGNCTYTHLDATQNHTWMRRAVTTRVNVEP
jgi:hypothetical protein